MAFKTSWLGKLSQAHSFRPVPYFKSALSIAYGYYAWSIFVACVAVFGPVAIVLHHPARAQRVLKLGARLLCRLCGIMLSIEGLDRLPPHPHILILNHTSFMDPVALIALLPTKPGYRFIARQQYRRQSLLWPLLKSVGTVILKRPNQHHDLPNVALLVHAIQARNNLVIFPEGEFLPEPGMRPFHSGAFVAAQQTNVPIVVAAIHGAAEVLRPGLWQPKKKPIKVAIGPVLYPGSVSGASIGFMMNVSRAAMVQLQEKLERPSPKIR
jgi:1-acyl-sn-glycerol-3-phosphate acyltransferase